MANDLEGAPQTVKWLMGFINRVGFPILAFLMMWYLCNQTLKENTSILSQVRDSLNAINVTLKKQ